ncbi:hypothetical protein [Paraburkholderia piptadeniae]|uniref:hypothetical protein n=1 Tax=Paraburkholderia piptadeniae TaxID=1701573 RepID=UPI00117BF1BC|nr:hypothetical protein [Paraburkholderia piptadeniae]
MMDDRRAARCGDGGLHLLLAFFGPAMSGPFLTASGCGAHIFRPFGQFSNSSDICLFLLVLESRQAYARAGLPCFGDSVDAMAKWTEDERAREVEEPRGRLPATVSIDQLGKRNISQCAIYDPETGDWHFVDLD